MHLNTEKTKSFNDMMATLAANLDEDAAAALQENEESATPAAAAETEPAKAPGAKIKKKPGAKATKPQKAAASGKRTKASGRPDGKKVTLGVYVTEEERTDLKIYCATHRVSQTDLMAQAILDKMSSTYECETCGCRFTLCNDTEEPFSPSCCPACGGTSLYKD